MEDTLLQSQQWKKIRRRPITLLLPNGKQSEGALLLSSKGRAEIRHYMAILFPLRIMEKTADALFLFTPSKWKAKERRIFAIDPNGEQTVDDLFLPTPTKK